MKNKKVKHSQKNSKVKQKLNPFEVHINRSKFKILGQKSKDDRGLPGVSRGKAHLKREKTLLHEYNNRYKSGTFVDMRIGEKDKFMDPEKKLMMRMTAEKKRQFSKKSIFNLNEDEELMHKGEPLNEVTMKDQSAISDDDAEEDMLDADFVKKQHFGGDLFTKKDDKEKNSGHKKNKQEWIDEIIAESKKKKAESKKEKEDHHDAVSKLDAKFQHFLTLLKGKGMTEEDKEKSKHTCEFRDYDMYVKEIAFDRSKRAQPTNRLKTEEELAKEEQERLQKLEEDRQRRMLGEIQASSQSHLSADALHDWWSQPIEPKNTVVQDDEPDEIVQNFLKDRNQHSKSKKQEGKSDAEESEHSESEEGSGDESGVEQEESGDESGVEQEESGNESGVEPEESGEESGVEQEESGNESGVEQEESREESGVEQEESGNESGVEQEESGDENYQHSQDEFEEQCMDSVGAESNEDESKNSDDESEEEDQIFSEKSDYSSEKEEGSVNISKNLHDSSSENDGAKKTPAKSHKLVKTAKTDPKKTQTEKSKAHQVKAEQKSNENDELPFTFEVPGDFDGFWELLQHRTPSQVSTIIERMISCNHPSFGADNKDKANTIFAYLLQTLHIVCSVDPEIISYGIHPLKYIDVLVPHLYTITQLNPPDCASALSQVIDEKYEECNSKETVRDYPYGETFIFLKVAGILFPASDYHHDVMTRVITFLTQLLGERRVNCGRDLVALLFTASLLFEYLSRSCRYVGELMNALHAILYLSIPPSDKKVTLPHSHPFKSVGPASQLLVLNEKLEKFIPPRLTFSLLNETIEINGNFKVKIINESLILLNKLCSKWSRLPAVRAVFKPTIILLDNLPVDNYPNETKSLVEKLRKSIFGLPEQVPHLVKKETNVKVLRMLEPSVEEIIDGPRNRGSNKQLQERNKLIHKLKREKKGARRELKRDAEFIARQQLKEVLQSDADRKRKVNLIMHGLSTQESEFKKYKSQK